MWPKKLVNDVKLNAVNKLFSSFYSKTITPQKNAVKKLH